MELEKHVLIVAGGDGKRMGSNLPKQFLLLDDKPILFHTFNLFLFIKDIKITLVLNSNQIDYWKNFALHTYLIFHIILLKVGQRVSIRLKVG